MHNHDVAQLSHLNHALSFVSFSGSLHPLSQAEAVAVRDSGSPNVTLSDVNSVVGSGGGRLSRLFFTLSGTFLGGTDTPENVMHAVSDEVNIVGMGLA